MAENRAPALIYRLFEKHNDTVWQVGKPWQDPPGFGKEDQVDCTISHITHFEGDDETEGFYQIIGMPIPNGFFHEKGAGVLTDIPEEAVRRVELIQDIGALTEYLRELIESALNPQNEEDEDEEDEDEDDDEDDDGEDNVAVEGAAEPNGQAAQNI